MRRRGIPKGTARSDSRKKSLGRYKSQLEKYCAERLAHENLSFEYESREYILQKPFHYNGIYYKMTKGSQVLSKKTNSAVLAIKYTPDFIGAQYNFIIETKGFVHDQHTFLLRWKMFLDYLMKNEEEPPALFLPKNKQQVDDTVKLIVEMIKDGRIKPIADIRSGDQSDC